MTLIAKIFLCILVHFLVLPTLPLITPLTSYAQADDNPSPTTALSNIDTTPTPPPANGLGNGQDAMEATVDPEKSVGQPETPIRRPPTAAQEEDPVLLVREVKLASPVDVKLDADWKETWIPIFISCASLVVAVCTTVFAAYTFRTVSAQTSNLQQSLALQSTLAKLAQVKLRLETLMRGSSMQLREQSLQMGEKDHTGGEQTRVSYIVNQICPEDDSNRLWVEELVKEWFHLERELDRITQPQKIGVCPPS